MQQQNQRTFKIAVLIPCYNEEKTIGKVVREMREVLPSSEIYVFNNNSTDKSAKIAFEAGAIVINEKRQGKGFVVASMFDKIVADYYLMIDGDDTYPVEAGKEMLEILMNEEADIVVANRLESYHKTNMRSFHSFGNKLVRWLINITFRAKIKDPMSGMRAFNYNAVTTIPFLSTGFEIETEMTIQALFRKLVIKEIDIVYRDRPEDSYSKLNTFTDGFSVLLTIFMLLKAYKPLSFFGGLGLLFFISGLASGGVVISEFIKTGYITHVPLSIFTISLVLVAFVLGITGIIIHTVNYRILESNVILLKISRHLHE